MTWLNGATVKTVEDKAAEQAEVKRQAFKAERQAKLNSATITTSTGKVFDADEKSITRMAESKNAVKDAIELGLISSPEDYPIKWVLHGSETGIGTDITYMELVEACALANQNRAKIWLKK